MGLLDLFDDEESCSVSEYTAAIKNLLERNIPPRWILGEVSNLRRQASGHVYFSLKDAGAQIPAVMFRGNAGRLDFQIDEGMEVLAYGEVSVYEPHGRYQLVVRTIRQSGQGRLFKEFEKLKKRLAAEGLFDVEKRVPLPLLPTSIAVVTSPTGAALRDFIQVLNRRGWVGCLRVFPCRVQGLGAAEEIARSIDAANEWGGFDVIVAMRGGGSIEDLWCFNEERVARSVASSRIPVISGVGHEIDFTLCDFAADIRAETPTGAAELLITRYLDTIRRLNDFGERMFRRVSNSFEDSKIELRSAKRALASCSPDSELEKAFLGMDELCSRFERSAAENLARKRNRIMQVNERFFRLGVADEIHSLNTRMSELSHRLSVLTERAVARLRSRFDSAGSKFSVMGPDATLQRGYAILEKSDGSILQTVASIREKELVTARLRDGTVELIATRKIPESRLGCES